MDPKSDWYSKGVAKPRGRPPRRCNDPLVKVFGQRCRQETRKRTEWGKCDLDQQ